MIKLSENQLLASSFVKIDMNIVFIFKNITFILYFSANEHSYELPYLRRPISDEISLDIRQGGDDLNRPI